MEKSVMNKKALFNIFDGEYCILDKIRETKSYMEIEEKIDQTIKKIIAEEDEEKRWELLSELNLLYGELESEIASVSFAFGFKSGLKIGAEVFTDNEV